MARRPLVFSAFVTLIALAAVIGLPVASLAWHAKSSPGLLASVESSLS